VIGGIVLAAGRGSRFGGPKQLAELEGRPLLEHAVEAMAGVPAIDPLVVVLGAGARDVAAGADLSRARTVVCEDWAEGQSSSLRAGIEGLGEVDAAVVTLGDQPGITSQVIAMVIDQALAPEGRWRATRATYHGAPGHPVVIPRGLFPRLRELRGDLGAREVLAEIEVREVDASHLCRSDDVDTPEQLEALRP